MRIDQNGGPSYILSKECFSSLSCKSIHVGDKIVVGDSGEGIAEVGVGTDEGVGEVNACTNVVGSDGTPATVIAVVTQGMSLREILTALRFGPGSRGFALR
jgi:hypothetical protein